MPKDTSSQLIRMYRADFASRSEVTLRFGATGVTAIALSIATHNWRFAAWLLAYLVQQYFYFRAIDPRRRQVTAARMKQARILSGIGKSLYLSAPLYFILNPDPNLFIPAAIGLVAHTLYVLHRENPNRDTKAIETLFFCLSCLMVYFAARPHLDHPILHLTVLGLSAICAFLFFRTQQVEERRQLARRNAERRYAQAQKARALNQFVGGVAHDFNNQLTAIMGNLELVDLLDDAEERRAAMRQCRVAAERADLTVQQLVASSGRTRLSPAPLDTGALLHDLLPVLEDLLEPGIDLVLAPATTPLTAHVDRDMLETCLIQLCLNAQDAMKGEGRITIGTVEQTTLPAPGNPRPEQDPPYVGLFVQDAGPGVANETLSKLSEPFFTTKGVSAGTGLGLSAVAGFAKQSGGALIIDNAMPNGLLVSLLLPLVKPAP